MWTLKELCGYHTSTVIYFRYGMKYVRQRLKSLRAHSYSSPRSHACHIDCHVHYDNLQVLAVHDSKQTGPDRGHIAWHLAYDLVYLDDHNRESEVPEEDVRAVQDVRHKDSLLTLRQKKEGPGQAGDSVAAEGKAGAVGVDGMSREEVQ